MQAWNVAEIEVEPHQPRVLDSEDEGRAIVIHLPAGESLQEHQVHERAWVLVVCGRDRDRRRRRRRPRAAAPGLLAVFDPEERHEVRATEDSRIAAWCSRRGPATGIQASAAD